MSAASEDRELEKVLVDAAQLRERYRAVSREEPPDALDALIRAASRDQTTLHVGRRLAASWRVPLSIAAVVVVSATVSVLVAERHGQLLPDADHSVSVPAAASKDEKRAGGEAPPAAPPDKSEGKGRPAAEYPQRTTPKQKGDAPQAASEAFSAPPESRTSEQPIKTQEAGTPAPSQNVQSSTAMQQAAPPPAASPPVEPERAEARRDQTPSEVRALEGQDRPSPERPADALRKERAAARSLASAAAKLEQDSGLVAARKSAPARAWETDPEAWLKHIDELRLAGQRADAETSFRAFRERYPGYRLPSGFVVPER